MLMMRMRMTMTMMTTTMLMRLQPLTVKILLIEMSLKRGLNKGTLGTLRGTLMTMRHCLLWYHMCKQCLKQMCKQSPPHMWVSASLWASRPLCRPWTSPTHSPLPNGFFTSLVHHPWVSRTPSIGTTCQPRMHIHRNLAPPLFSIISNIPLLGFFSSSFFFLL